MTSERHCIVTHQALDKTQMIRFAVSPELVITPDIAEKLPGRGIWITTTAEALTQAIKDKLFAKAARQQVTVPDDLADKVELLLKQHALEALALCRKAGEAICGFDTILRLKTPERIAMILHAADAGEHGIRKLKAAFPQAEHCAVFTREELSQPMGGENVVHVALTNTPPAQHFIRKAKRFTGFIGNPAI